MSAFTYTETEASETEAKHLLLRQVAKDVTIRLSEPLKVAESKQHTNLLSVSNSSGLIFAATNSGFVVIRLAELRSFLKSASRNSTPTLDQTLRSIDTNSLGSIASLPSFITSANNHSTVLVGFQNGAIAAWSVSGLVDGTKLEPSFVLQPPAPGLSLIDLAPNPSDRPELAVALYRQEGTPGVQSGTPIILNLNSGSFGAQLDATGSRATAVCWSVKGKQVAVGLESGEIVQITPEGEPKDRIAKPESLQGSFYLSDLRWLENHVFVATYNLPSSGSSDDDPEHSYEVFTILRDVKQATIIFAKMPMDPAPPYGDTSRPGTRFAAWLKSWAPSKHLLFVASGPSTDVGLISCSSSEAGTAAWSTVELEETSKPILPFSSADESSDTAPVALDFDLTSTDEVDDPNAVARGDDQTKMPAVPILYVYTSDGVLLAYNVINTQQKFDGMIRPSATQASSTATMSTTSTTAPAPASTPAQSTPGQTKPAASAFGSSSAFGQPSAFGQSPGFGSKSTFGSSATPSFGQSSAFGSSSSASSPSPAFGAASASTPSSGFGFGAFSSAAGGGQQTSAFGSTGFGFGSASTTSKDASPVPSKGAPTPFASSNAAASPSVSAFGAKPAASAFASSSPAPSITTAPSAFGSTSAFGQNSSAKPAFGQSSAFGQTSAPAFGSASGFGTTSAFGTSPAFGAKNAFSSAASSASPFAPKTDTSTPPSTTSAFGGFASKSGGAFGSTTSPSSTSIFGNGGQLQSKSTAPSTELIGSAAQNATTSPSPSSAFGSSASKFGQGSFSAFAANKTVEDREKETKGENDESSSNGKADAGSFSFGGLGSMLGSNDSTLSSRSQADPASEAPKKEAGSSSTDSSVKTANQTPKNDAAPKPFSFNPASASSSSGSKASDPGSSTATAGATPPPAPASAFSSFKPAPTAGAPSDRQPSPSNANSSSVSSTSSATAENNNKEQPASTQPSEEKSKTAEPAKPAFNLATAPAKPTASPPQLSFSSPDSKAETPPTGSNDEAKPASPATFSFAPASEPSFTAQPSSPLTFGVAGQNKNSAEAQTAKPATPFSFANNTSASPASKPSGFGSFGSFGSTPTSSAPQTKEVPSFSFASSNKSIPSSSPPNASASVAPASTPAANPTSTSAPASGGSFPRFNSTVPRSSSPLAATPFSSNDDTSKSSSEEKLGPAGNTSQPFSFQQQPAKPSTPTFSAKPTTSFSGFSQPQPSKISDLEKPTPAPAAAPSFGGFGPATANSSPQSASMPSAPGKSAKERIGSPLVAGRTPQLSSSDNPGPAKVNEGGIQGEFLKAYLVLSQELEVLRSNVDQCASFLADLREASARSHSVEDFADPSKWSFGDLPKMLLLAKSLGPLTQRIENEAASHKRKVAELQSLQLKAEAKREEVARFIRARSDPEFAKMIRVRQLGPEHVENQNKLRKASQVVRDRIVELEEYMAALKDKLQNARAGRSALKAPSLDSVARACRNITARTTAVTLDLDNLALEVDLMRPAEYASREPSRAISRSVSVVSGIEEAGPLNDVSNLMRVLPAATTLRSVDEITRAELVKSESAAVFINAREKPFLNTRAVPSSQRADRKTTKPLLGSDLQIAFAKGPVHLGKRASPAIPETRAANGVTDVVGADQFAPMAKEVAVPKLSEPPRPSSTAVSTPATAQTEAKPAPLYFGFPTSPGPASTATPAAASQKTAAPPTPLNLSGFGQTAAAPAKVAKPTFGGFAPSAAPLQPTTTAAAPAASSPQPTVPSQPLKFEGFGQSTASSPKPAITSFAGFGKTPVSSPDVSAQKGATQSAPMSFGGFGQAAAKPDATSFAGFGKASTPSADTSSPAAPAAESQKTAAPFSFGGFSSSASASPQPTPAPFAGFGSTPAPPASAPLQTKSTPTSTPGAASTNSPFGNATLSSLDFGKLSSVPAGIFDLPAKDDTPFQPGARAASASPSSIRSSNTSKSKFRGTAVQLPPTSSGADGSDAAASASTKAASDFFALPPAPKAKEGSDASAPTPFKGFSGFGSSAGKPNAEVSTPAPSSKPTFSFGKPGNENESPAPAPVGSASASGSIDFGKVDKTDISKSPATFTASQSKTASSGFSFGGSGTKSVEAASAEQPKPASATSFSFGDAGKKPETAKSVADESEVGTFTKHKVDTAASAASSTKEESESPASFSFRSTNPPVKPAPEEKSEKVATEDRKGEEKKGADGEEADKPATADSKVEKSEKSDGQQKDADSERAEKADAKHATSEALPDPSTFTFCKPSEPRNKEPLTEPTSSESKDALTSKPDAKPAASFSFGTASAAPTSENKTENLDRSDKEERSSSTEQSKASSANGATSTDKADGDFSYPPKPKSPAADSDNQEPAESSTPTTTSTFSFAPSKLNPSASSTASAFGGFKSSPGFGFGAFSSKPTDASSPSSKPVNAFSFAPQTSTANKPGAFGSVSAFGSTSAFGTPSTPFAKPAFGSTSAFGAPSGFGAFASSPSTPKSTDGGKGEAAAGKSAFSFAGASGGGFGAFAGAGKTSPFASAKGNGESLGGDSDKSGGSLLARLGGKPSQVASEDEEEDEGEDEDEEEDEDNSGEDDEEDDDDEEEEEDYDDEEEYTDEEDYEDEDEVDDDDDVDSAISHDRAEGDSLEESAVHVEKADAQEEGDSVDGEEEQDDDKEDDAEEERSDEEEEDEEEGLSAVEEEPEEEEEAAEDTTAAQGGDKSD